MSAKIYHLRPPCPLEETDFQRDARQLYGEALDFDCVQHDRVYTLCQQGVDLQDAVRIVREIEVPELVMRGLDWELLVPCFCFGLVFWIGIYQLLNG